MRLSILKDALFLKNSPAFFYALPYSLFMVEWGRWALLNKSIQSLHDSGVVLHLFWGGEVINWGFWIGVRWEQVLFPHPLYFYEVVWDVMMIFNYFFVMSWFWHRFSFLGGNSGSTKFGIASHHLRIFWKINTFPFLPLFWLRLVLGRKKTHFSFGNFLPTSWKAWQKL